MPFFIFYPPHFRMNVFVLVLVNRAVAVRAREYKRKINFICVNFVGFRSDRERDIYVYDVHCTYQTPNIMLNVTSNAHCKKSLDITLRPLQPVNQPANQRNNRTDRSTNQPTKKTA